jgi:hypothetical protein
VDEVVQYCAGLDVHRDTVVATVRFPQGRQRGSETKTFGTDTAELVELGDWLITHRVTRVGLESTGVYWKPVFYLLGDRIEQVWLLNAQHLKNVPGRKTDLLTELLQGFWGGCVPGGVGLARFAARDWRWRTAAGFGGAGGAGAGWSGGDRRSVPAVSAG